MNSIDSGIGSAIAAGYSGLQQAQADITQASENIAERTMQTSESQNQSGSGSSTSGQSSAPAGNMTSDLVSLKMGSINAEANAKVLGTSFDNLGTIIDILA
ncbi:hypothetical protein [Alteromonas sp. ASW11-130]|uniref:hypothetical protein n=1 Tax=Alteromonas sp. ASW11-130 TaxID=3015775 RepID=UPI0022425E13|nr:hypothetical protein [Alteromonas sp. ASW11-130]MCW8093317.1 hypothetical protein [Alteromonas sp. ASW11-130]